MASDNHAMPAAPAASPFAPASDVVYSESARLLDSSAKEPATLVFASPSPETRHALTPPMAQITTASPIKPADIGDAPSNVDEWPKDRLRIPCTHCGHYVETSVNEETGEALRDPLSPPRPSQPSLSTQNTWDASRASMGDRSFADLLFTTAPTVGRQ